MDRTASPTGGRAAALAAALFAITLNFLQPLAHAALMRDGSPSILWSVFCDSRAADPDGKSTPVAAADHECCLGLAHAPSLAAPPDHFIALPAVSTAAATLPAPAGPTPVGIRDGPSQPRGPPTFA